MVYTVYRRGLAPLLIAFTLVLCVSSIAHADGGAPNLAYVSGGGKGISVVDVSQQVILRTINLPGAPDTVALSQDARFLYVTRPDKDKLAILAAKTGQQICDLSIPGNPSLLLNDISENNTLYVAGNNASGVTVVDGTDCSVKRKLATNGDVHGLGLASVGTSLPNSSGDQIWVSSTHELQVFDGNTGQQISAIPIPGESPSYLTIPPGATVYASTLQGTIDAIDLNSHKVIQILSGGKYGPMDYDAATGEIYVPDIKNNRLAVLSPINAGFAPPTEPNRTIPLPSKPASVAITSDGQFGFVAMHGGDVLMLDIPGHATITTYHVGGHPSFIISGLYPPELGTTPQSANVLTTVVNILGYALLVALFIVPIFLFRRFSKTRKPVEAAEKSE